MSESKYMTRARELRAIVEPHHNCAQSVIMPFAAECGLTEQQAFALGAHFGSGMRMGETCGAVTGGLMVLGLCGLGSPEASSKLVRAVRANHGNMIDCRDLLKANAEAGRQKKPHCDAMVFEAVTLVEDILRENGII